MTFLPNSSACELSIQMLSSLYKYMHAFTSPIVGNQGRWRTSDCMIISLTSHAYLLPAVHLTHGRIEKSTALLSLLMEELMLSCSRAWWKPVQAQLAEHGAWWLAGKWWFPSAIRIYWAVGIKGSWQCTSAKQDIRTLPATTSLQGWRLCTCALPSFPPSFLPLID